MAKQTINVGVTANDRKGDSLRAAFQKVNANFTELYTALGIATDINLNLGNFVFTDNTLSLTNTNNDDSTATQIEIAQPVRIESNLTVGGDILPNGNLNSTIGSPTNKFHSIYVGTGSVYLGDARLSLEGGRISSSVGFDLTDSVGVVNGTVGWSDVTGKPSILSGDDVIGSITSDTITEETPGGTISQTTSYQNQIIIDTTDAIRIANVISQTVNDGVTTATDSTGSTIDVDGTGAYIKRYVEPDGPNNSSYFQFSTTNSGAIIEGVNEDLVGNTYGRVTVTQGVVAINAAAGGIDKEWLFDSDGNLTVPGNIIFPGNTARIYGNTDLVGLLANPNIGAGLEIAAGSTVNLFNEGNVIISSNVNQISGQKDWTFKNDGELQLPSNGSIKQNFSWTRTTSPSVTAATPTIVWTSAVDYISSAKLTIQVEGNEVGDDSGWHSQACEAIIACRGYANAFGGPGGDPQMIVYGVVHTSVDPLVTFTVQRNPATKMVEIVGTPTAAANGGASLRIHSVEMSTRD